MTNRYFIVAGNHAEYKDWLRENRSRFPANNINDFIWVHSSDVFRGSANPHGFFVGTFGSRADLHDIVQTIVMSSPDLTNQAKYDLISSVLPLTLIHASYFAP